MSKISLYDEIDATLKHFFYLDGNGNVVVEYDYIEMVVQILYERIANMVEGKQQEPGQTRLSQKENT